MNKLLISLCLITFAITLLAQTSDVPTMINYQGRLTNPNGAPVADNTYTIEFSIWDDMTSDDVTHRLWAQTMYPVVVKNGVFAVMLTNLDSNLLKGELWFQLKVGEDPALKPRQRIASVVFALRAGKAIEAEHAKEADFAENAGIADTVINGSITNDKLGIGVAIPPGVILMWHGSTTDIPIGWSICNGQNGTPDLRNRFIVGAGLDYLVNAIGGEVLNSHIHTIDHTHYYFGNTTESIGGYGAFGSGSLGPEGHHHHDYSGNTQAPSNGWSGTPSNTENRPPYYALCYIMKLGY